MSLFRRLKSKLKKEGKRSEEQEESEGESSVEVCKLTRQSLTEANHGLYVQSTDERYGLFHFGDAQPPEDYNIELST